MWEIIVVAVVIFLLVVAYKLYVVKNKQTALTNKSKNSAISEKERFLMKECRELAECKGYDFYGDRTITGALFRTMEARLIDVQQREAQKEAAQQAIELEHFKMIKSMETFNLLCQMIMQNPILAEKLRSLQEEGAVDVLRSVSGFSEEQFKNNKRLLLQVVDMVKTGVITCKN